MLCLIAQNDKYLQYNFAEDRFEFRTVVTFHFSYKHYFLKYWVIFNKKIKELKTEAINYANKHKIKLDYYFRIKSS